MLKKTIKCALQPLDTLEIVLDDGPSEVTIEVTMGLAERNQHYVFLGKAEVQELVEFLAEWLEQATA